jgi:hypothetical protein
LHAPQDPQRILGKRPTGVTQDSVPAVLDASEKMADLTTSWIVQDRALMV